MFACGSKFVSKVNWFIVIDQLMANARTTVVVKQSPIAAVAVNSERFIFRTICNILNISFH